MRTIEDDVTLQAYVQNFNLFQVLLSPTKVEL
ncbi:MAG: hypothetical protein ETSY2_48650 [Candidatus Entotheonella gemina]|uniref:Uncharacterized protein n=1 Tax=Candidatus Entotheonella gemina TaxID=1429439 RepID=W4LAH2_9BACT|nr:MAG: hypothetical protein ETSY2_48650 [Candidatus Entotheonella gemina]